MSKSLKSNEANVWYSVRLSLICWPSRLHFSFCRYFINRDLGDSNDATAGIFTLAASAVATLKINNIFLKIVKQRKEPVLLLTLCNCIFSCLYS